VGFKVSQALSRITGDRYSAGRVQSPALRLVVDREREIEGFNSTTYYGVQAEFITNNTAWVASWDIKPFLSENEKYMLDRAVADEVATVKDFTVATIASKETQQPPKGAFTTSTLQQAASVALKIKPKETMSIAQKLFADGLITYMRTDSPNLSEEAIKNVWAYLSGEGKDDYIPKKPHTYKAKSGSQEAHEATRPTDFMNLKPNELDGKALALYRLIWERAVASQMKAARFDVTTAILKTDKSIDGKDVTFVAKGKVLLFNGWLSLTTDKTEEDKTISMDDQQLPTLSEGQSLTSNKTDVLTKQTKPPSRYTQASLIKKLESEEIGRPSTYASILDRLFSQNYIVDEKNKLKPLDRGCTVRDALVSRFSFVEYEYTRQMEQGLDDITEGRADYLSLVKSADEKLDVELNALGDLKIETPVGEPCPQADCSGHLRLKKSKKGPFWGCSHYPDCSFTVDDKSDKPDIKSLEENLCPSCNKPMKRRKGSHGFFWGCTGFPDCKQTFPDKRGKPDTEIKDKPKVAVSDEFKCGECESPLIKRPSKKGKGFWWGCSGFPGCKTTYFDDDGKPKYSN
jgi:DNA topoisomerase-1